MTEPRASAPSIDTAIVIEPAVLTETMDELEMEPLLDTNVSLWAVVFAGGIGTRFWPLSTPKKPKQLLALVGETPLIADPSRVCRR